MTPCPPVNVLTDYLAERLGGARRDAVESHLQDCFACQGRLEQLTSTIDHLSERRRPAEKLSTLSPDAGALLERIAALDSAGAPTAGHNSGAAPAELPTLLGYEIFEEVGRGGMGVVYKARQRSLNRVVALKMILAGGAADPERRDLFRAEAEAIARLTHPAIVQIHEVGEHAGAPILCLEYADGGSLDKKLGGNPQPALDAAEFVAGLARAMQFAHERGVVHRDLKPANVLLTADGAPKITDFGLAKHLDSGKTLLRPGAVAGTPGYMAPEQVRGSKDLSPAVDVYALGAILYELLTGRPPFGAASAYETLLQVVHEEPVSPRQLQPKLPRDLETICLKCLGKDPRKRYARAADLADDLERFVAGRPILARPSGTFERTAKWARRRPAVASLLAAVVTVAILALIVLGWGWQQASARANAEGHAKTEAQINAVREKAARLEVEALSANTVLDQANNLCEQGEVGHGLLLFAHALELAEHAGRGDLERVARWNLAGWQSKFIRRRAELHHAGFAWALAYSPDGRTLVTAGQDKLVQRWDAATGRSLGPPLKHDHEVWAVAFSPDGQRVLTGSAPNGGAGQARLWDAMTGEPVGPRLALASGVQRVEFAAGGRTILTFGPPVAQLWDAETGKPIGPALHAGGVLSAVVSRDGKTVLTGGADKTARLWDAASGEPLGEPLAHPGAVILVALSPDGKMLATASRPAPGRIDERGSRPLWSEVRLWETETHRPRGPALVAEGLIKAMAFSPDGTKLAAGTAIFEFDHPTGRWRPERGQVRLWDAETAQPTYGPLFHPMPVWSLAFRPDGRLLLTGCEDGRARFFEVVSGRAVSRPLMHEGTVTAVAFSPDGSSAATSSAGGDSGASARLWEIPPLPEVFRALPGLREPDHAMAFTPDQGMLLVANPAQTALERFDLKTRTKVEPPLSHGAVIRSFAFIAAGREVLTFGDDKTAKVWDLATGACRRQWPTEDSIHHAAVSSDGRRLLTGSGERKIRLWDVETARPLIAPLACCQRIGGVAFAADGTPLWIETGETESGCWRLTGGGLPERISRWDDVVLRCGFGPDANIVLTRGWANRPVVRSPFHDEPLGPFAARHADAIQDFAVSRNAGFFVTGGMDHTARLWDVMTGKPLGPPLAHPGRVGKVALSPDEHLLAVQSDAIYLWPLPTPAEGSAAEVCGRLRSLTSQELDAQGGVHDLASPQSSAVREPH